MNIQDLQNLTLFLKRAPMTGEEARAWCRCDDMVKSMISTLQTPASTEPAATPEQPTP